MKLNVLLAKTEHFAKTYSAMVRDYIDFFAKGKSAFIGKFQSYTPEDGTLDEPGENINQVVSTTVAEKLTWFEENAEPYINHLFKQEATNAAGVYINLKVEGEDWGKVSTLELLRLKTLLENPDLQKMYETLPVRSDTELWNKSAHTAYVGRDVFELPVHTTSKNTLLKTTIILADPNLEKLGNGAKYTPVTAEVTTPKKLGTIISQRFTGETSHRFRATVLKRKSVLYDAVITALKEANEAEAVNSAITANKIFSFLHKPI